MPFRLYPCDLDALVRLDVRAKSYVVALGDLAHPLGVAANAREVEQERWCFDFFDSHFNKAFAFFTTFSTVNP